MVSYLDILCGVTVVFLTLYYWWTKDFDYWTKRGIKGPQPIPIFGNAKDLLTGKHGIGDYLKNQYDIYKGEPVFGIFMLRKPVLILRDPELIKDVLIKDFTVFADRGLGIHEKAEPLSQHLFGLEPKRWRPLRARLSPVFTSGKLKEMFSLIVECSEHLEKYLEKLTATGEPIECRDLTSKFTTDVIGSCAFGIETNALSDEESEFFRMGKKIFDPTFTALLRFRVREFMPWLYDLLGYVMPYNSITTFFIGLILDTIKYRKENNIVRHDFVNTLMEIREHPEKMGDVELTDHLIAAQAFVFFAAGFETSSTTMSNALYELALYPKVQDTLREEIRQAYTKNNSDLTYYKIKELKYLDAVFRETLRKYPPVTVLSRMATEDYTFESVKLTVPKKTKVWIPVYAIQRDPTIYPDPDTFDPDRFTSESMSARHPMYFLPFGDGPRNCIGARFAVYQTKIGLIKILRNHKVEVCEKTQIPYVNNPKSFLLAPMGGIHLKITRVDN